MNVMNFRIGDSGIGWLIGTPKGNVAVGIFHARDVGAGLLCVRDEEQLAVRVADTLRHSNETATAPLEASVARRCPDWT